MHINPKSLERSFNNESGGIIIGKDILPDFPTVKNDLNPLQKD